MTMLELMKPERMWCRACGTVTADMLCDCNHWPDGHEMKREPEFVNYSDSLQSDMQEIMRINNELREIVLAARDHVPAELLARIDAAVRGDGELGETS